MDQKLNKMTYPEIRKSLTFCEKKLEELRKQNSSDSKVKVETKKYSMLKESLEKRLKESEENMFVSTKGGDTKAVSMTRKQAADLKRDPNVTDITTTKGADLKEQDGVEFSKSETTAIAKEVGKGLAKALRGYGDEIDSMKVTDIEPNSFEIKVTYKNDSEDQFSFYIEEDTLHLVDFSFDKPLIDVGVKPSGEPIVHIEVLTNELLKHFKSLQEDMSDQEFADAKERERLDKHPEKSTIEKIKALLDKERKAKEIKEAPEGRFYIEVAVRDARKALDILNDVPAYSKAMELDGSNLYYFDDQQLAYDAMMDLGAHGVEILGTNIEEDSLEENESHDQGGDLDVGHQDDEPDMLKQYAYDIAQYAAKLYKQLDKYDRMDAEVDFPNWWQSKVILAREYISKAQHYLEFEEKQPALDQLALEGKEGASKEEEERFHKKLDTLVHKTFGKGEHEKVMKEDWGSSDQNFMNQSIHKDLGEPISMPSPFNEKLESAVEDAVDSYWNDWEEYDTDREGLLEKAKQLYLSAMFPDTFAKLQSMFSESVNEASVEKLQKKHAEVVGKMKELAQLYKAGDKSVVNQLKDLTQEKKSLEAQIEKKVSKIGVGQEYDDSVEETMNEASVESLQKQLADVKTQMKAIVVHYKGGNKEVVPLLKQLTAKKKELESQLEKAVSGIGIGQEYDDSVEESKKKLTEAKATCCGKCGRVHVKGTECKRPFLKGKDHCRFN